MKVPKSLAREHALMRKFFVATGLGALNHWYVYQQWKAKQRKKKR